MRTSRLLRVATAGLLLPVLLLAACTTADEAAMAKMANDERSRHGVRQLVVDDKASDLARSWSATMARENRLRHNPDLARQITRQVTTNWRTYGENVGYAGSPQEVHRRFMQSSGHRANILNGAYKRVGVGVVAKDGRLWVTMIFIG
jgi:uncharacterized protein YkwD